MNTHLEDLSNEIFFKIFTSFTSLNRRISSILQSIPLRVVISKDHCRRQVDYLSFHLTLHAHQVISLNIYDTIRGGSTIISLLFNRHNFINLQSRIISSIDSSTKLGKFVKQIQSFNRLVLFHIYQRNTIKFNENDRNHLTRTLLTHIPSLRSIVLQYCHNYSDVFNYTSIPSNLTSLKLFISVPPSVVSVYSVLPILRHCHTIHYLGIVLEQSTSHNDNNISSSIQAQYNDDPPILQRIISSDLAIIARCDNRSITHILRSMPNLIRFNFILTIPKKEWTFPGELLDGYVWQQIFERYVPCLSKFEFHMTIWEKYPRLDLDIVINSFDYFVEKYFNWHMVIDRWKYNRKIRDIKHLLICIIKRRPDVIWSSPLFQQIKHLKIETPIKCSSLWNNLLNLVDFRQRNSDDDANQYATYLSQFVYLPSITQTEFGLSFDKSDWKEVEFILQERPNVNNLIIDARLLLLSKFIDNPSLVRIFNDIKKIKSTRKNIYFPSNFASKFVQHFPSLTDIERQVFSFDHCVSIIHVFLSHLKYLSYIKINYSQDTLRDDPFSRDYIIEKRCQTFPNSISLTNNKSSCKIME